MSQIICEKVRGKVRSIVLWDSLAHSASCVSDVLARHVRNHGTESKDDTEEPEGQISMIDTDRALEPASRNVFSDFAPVQSSAATIGDSNQPSSVFESQVGLDEDHLRLEPVQFPTPAPVNPMQQPSMTGTDFDLSAQFGFDLDFPSVYESLNIWLPPTGMEDHGFPSFSPASQGTNNSNINNTVLTDATSQDLSKRVQRAWPRRRASPVIRLIRTMWRCASEHPADNFFSLSSSTTTPTSRLQTRRSPNSRWNMDDECRSRLMTDCENNLLPAESYTGGVTAPGSPHISVPSEHEEVELEGISPQVPRLNFPSTEMLNMSIDFYFRRFHPVLPFLHQATFDARSTPSSLLLPICLIGLSILNPIGSEDFIRQYLGKLIRFCRLNLTYKGLGKGGAQQLLTSLTSALLVLYLGLSCERLVDEYQAHMLAIQTLFIADRHGMFAAHEGEAVTLDMFQSLSGAEEQWKSWARVESVKRVVIGLISIDSAYTRMLDLAANIGIDRVEVVLPCDSSLFDAPSASAFFRKVDGGSSMLGSRVDLGAASRGGGTKPWAILLNSLGLRTLLDVLALREAAYRHKLLSKASSLDVFRHLSFIPSLAYAQHEDAGGMARDLVAVSRTQIGMIYKDAPTSLSWNHLCLLLCVDIDRVQTGCGRTGLQASLRALRDLTLWSQSASARRAVLHSAEIFRVLSQQRVSDVKTLLPELLLSNAALVMAIYVFVATMSVASTKEPLELLQSIDWADVGIEGFSTSLERTSLAQSQSSGNNMLSFGGRPAWAFIIEGGPFTFGSETYTPGATSARKVVLTYAQLLDEISPRGGSEYARLLRTIGDFLGGLGEYYPQTEGE